MLNTLVRRRYATSGSTQSAARRPAPNQSAPNQSTVGPSGM